MLIELNFRSGKAAYLQIVDQVKYAAAADTLRCGEALPGIRPLAQRLHLNRNTVAKAYTELERQGVIEVIPGKGCFLSKNNSPLKKSARTRIVREAIDLAVVQAHHLQISDAEVLRLVKERLDAFGVRNPETAPNA